MEEFATLIEIVAGVVTQMSDSSGKQKNISIGLIAAIFAVFAIESWVIPSCKDKWKCIIQIASNSAQLLAFYLALCILKPEWLSWRQFVIVCIIAIASTCSYELYQDIKTKFRWCYEKGVIVINYVIHKVLKPSKDPVLPISAPPRAYV